MRKRFRRDLRRGILTLIFARYRKIQARASSKGAGLIKRHQLPASHPRCLSFAIALATAQPSNAQSSSPEESAARATMQSQTPGGTWAVIEAQVKNTLEEAGFKNIQVKPSSFVVQAEKDGQPLTLVIHSDGKTVSYLAVPPAK